MTHALARGCSNTCNIGDHRLGNVRLDVFGRGFLIGAADLPDHDDALGGGAHHGGEHEQAVAELPHRLAVFGPGVARRVVLAGFVTGVICSLIGTQIMGEFGPLVTLRIAVGSGLAFLVAPLLDVSIFAALRGGRWWRAPLVSTLVGSSLDTALFFTVAFSGALTYWPWTV